MSTATLRTFLLPDLGEGLTEASVVQWLVAEGDVVAVDQAVVEVETAKSVVEVPSPYAGRVGELHAAEGQLVDVGRPLITILADGDGAGAADVPDAAGSGAAGEREGEVYREEERAGSGNVLIGYGTPPPAGSGRRRPPRGALSAVPDRPIKVISPIVRRLAREAGLDLRAIRPTGAGGVVTRSDVRAAAAAARAPVAPPGDAVGGSAGVSGGVSGGPSAVGASGAPGPVSSGGSAVAASAAGAEAGGVASGVTSSGGERRIPLTGFQKAAAAVLTRSRAEIPEATVWVDVDATALWELREASRTPGDDGPGLLAHVARFVVRALQEFPVLNARLDVERGEIVVPGTVNLGIAVQGELGLVAPAVLGADALTTAALDAAIREVVGRARAGRSTPRSCPPGRSR
nr:hypothetical protein GCM10025730_12470 [Promicromonospora thailandica]